MDVATLAGLLHSNEHPTRTPKSAAEHNWWDWYAAYLNAAWRKRLGGGVPGRQDLHGGHPGSSLSTYGPPRRPLGCGPGRLSAASILH